MKDLEKEFKPTTWSINNRTSIFIVTIIITLAGIASYISLPKEKFPDIVIPTIYVTTIYPGTSPTDMENLVTKQIEKQIKGISGIKKFTSNSVQDYSSIVVEFNTGVDVNVAKQEVKDAVDKARTDLPSDLPHDPEVIQADISQMPILYVNLSGNYDLNKLKKYADDVKDQIEAMPEITRVDEVGALDREIQINVNVYKMEAAKISMNDISNAVANENITISGGTVKMDGMNRSLSVDGQFTNIDQIKNIVVRSMAGGTVYIKDIADVKDTFADQVSYARLDHKNVITLNVVKRAGENLIEASDKVREIVATLQKTTFPKDLKITLTGDQSSQTRSTLHDLINTIIIGFILVTIILMFFMGGTNALFVAMSVPLSMFIAFLILPTIGFALNMIVLFAFLLALGIVVDDAIVVIENTHRIFDNGKVPIAKAAKMAAGEIFLPVLAGTLTTLAPFIPLAFWGGIIGKFMFYLPVTLIITLLASLVVAYIINPVFAVAFMKPHPPETGEKKKHTGLKITSVIFLTIAILFYVFHFFGMGNFLITLMLINIFNRLVLMDIVKKFQTKTWPSIQTKYKSLLMRTLKYPKTILGGTFLLFVIAIMLFMVRTPNVVFFPQSDPNFVYVYLNLPVGTSQSYTDSITKVVEHEVYKVIGEAKPGEHNPVVESVISNVAVGATDPQENDQGTYSNKSKISVSFVEFGKRHGVSTRMYLNKIRAAVKDMPGVQISVDQEASGPPTPKPIDIEVSGDKFEDLVSTSAKLKHYLDSLQIGGIEDLRSDLENHKPEIVFDIDRERANREGISTAQIGMEIRNAVFGKEVSKFRDANDEYPIELRYERDERDNIDALNNLKITYRDMNMGGKIRQVPMSAFVKIHYSSSYGGIKRKNNKPLISLTSNVLSGYNANKVVADIQTAITSFKAPDGVQIKMGGEQEDQKETASFLGHAMLISLMLIFLILVTQFNSISKPFIILSEIIFSLIGVMLGFSIFKMDMSIVMTGVGFIALAGIVVRNGILLVEFTDLLREQGYTTLDAVIEAGKTRMTPVILTACATILGLIPLAVGFNIDFVTMFTELNPHIYFGGDSVAFWGPLSWTMIFGLSFATVITLIVVPVMYLLADNAKIKSKKLIEEFSPAK